MSLEETEQREREQYKGRSVERLEDQRILSGNSQYVDDIDLPNMLHASIFRSSHAHARLESVDVSEALSMPGVVDTIAGQEAREMANDYGARRSGMKADHPPLARDKVRFAGEGVAAVAAETQYQAVDALDGVRIEYDPLPEVLGIETAMEAADEEALVHPELADQEAVDGNTWGPFDIDIGDVDAAFEEAAHVVTHEIETSRPTAAPLEPHGSIADYDPGDGSLTLYTSTQESHQVRRELADVLDMPVSKVRVVLPENMGGGFGHKLELHENEVVAALLSIKTERPVKVVLNRLEEFKATRARQPQCHQLELALDEKGNFLAIRDDIVAESGAYAGLTRPGLWVSCNLVATPYEIENIRVSGESVFTNTVPSGAYRGFGMTQAATARESLVDRAADECGFDPWELRRRNLVSDDDCPTTHPMGFHLDSCGTVECLDLVRNAIDTDLLDEDTPRHVVRGLGVGTAMHVSSAQRPAYTSDNSSATIRMDEDGSVTVTNDQCPMGTGVETALAQIIADEIGVDYRAIDFSFGDTETAPFGLGSWGSRAMAVSGSAALEAARALRDQLVRIAAHQLEVERSDLVVAEGEIHVADDPSRGRSLTELAHDAHYNGRSLPDGMTAGGLVVTESFDSPAPGQLDDDGRADIAVNYPSNVHAAVVEVDTETGLVSVLDYAVADDVGEVINPMIVEGQIQGGVAQGLGMALGETLEYDSTGQLRNGTLEDYQLPLISEAPKVTKIFEADTTSERAPLGTKGVGESGAILAPVAVLNAANDALLGDYLSEPTTTLPLSPERVFELCRDGRGAGDAATPDGGDR
jgi:carbon-monoxide dehydrogenase large subunit